MKMGRIKIKHPKPKELGTRRQLLEILAPEVRATRLIPSWDAVIVITTNDKDSDALFSEDKQEKLHAAGFTALMPPELRSQRTVVCFQLDDLIYENEEQNIKEEIEVRQPWAKVRETYKFPLSKTIKITFESSHMATKAREGGLLMFHMAVSPSQIRAETYTPIMSCNRCYAVEEHLTRQCPAPTTYVVCSECASRDHTHIDCRATEKNCVNCGQNHSARAMRCPIRKKALKEKEERQRLQSSKSYAQATQPIAVPQQQCSNSVALLCLLQAHLVECSAPGSFQKTLSESLALNGLKDVKLPTNPPSSSIMKAITADIGSYISNSMTEKAEKEKADDSPPPQPCPIHESSSDTEEEEINVDQDPTQNIPARTTSKNSSISFNLIKKNADTWPKDYPRDIITQGIQEGRYKILHDGEQKDTPLIIKSIKNTTTPLTSFCISIEDKKFDCIENGPFSRTPAQKKKRTTRKRQ